MTVMTEPAIGPQRISDLNVAAFLLAKGHRLLGTDFGGARVTFLFDAPDSAVSDYFDENCVISPRKLLNALRDLKGILQQGRRR